MSGDTMLICNATHKCHIKECYHNKPHKSNFGKRCGPSMPCHASGILSACVDITDGTYRTHHKDWCKHCGGKGFTERIEVHQLDAGEGQE